MSGSNRSIVDHVKRSVGNKRLGKFSSKKTPKGRRATNKTLNPKGIHNARNHEMQQGFKRLQGAPWRHIFIVHYIDLDIIFTAMNDEERAAIQAVRDIPNHDFSLPDVSMESPLSAHDILDSSVAVNLSHNGGELRQILEDDAEDDDGWYVKHKLHWNEV